MRININYFGKEMRDGKKGTFTPLVIILAVFFGLTGIGFTVYAGTLTLQRIASGQISYTASVAKVSASYYINNDGSGVANEIRIVEGENDTGGIEMAGAGYVVYEFEMYTKYDTVNFVLAVTTDGGLARFVKNNDGNWWTPEAVDGKMMINGIVTKDSPRTVYLKIEIIESENPDAGTEFDYSIGFKFTRV